MVLTTSPSFVDALITSSSHSSCVSSSSGHSCGQQQQGGGSESRERGVGVSEAAGGGAPLGVREVRGERSPTECPTAALNPQRDSSSGPSEEGGPAQVLDARSTASAAGRSVVDRRRFASGCVRAESRAGCGRREQRSWSKAGDRRTPGPGQNAHPVAQCACGDHAGAVARVCETGLLLRRLSSPQTRCKPCSAAPPA